MRICGQIEFIKHRRVYFCHFLNFYIFFVVFLKTVKMLKLQFLSCKKYSEHWSTVKNCNFSKLQFFKCTSTVILLHIFAVYNGSFNSFQRLLEELEQANSCLRPGICVKYFLSFPKKKPFTREN